MSYQSWNKKQKGFIGFWMWLGYSLLWTVILISETKHAFWSSQVIMFIAVVCLGCGYILLKILSRFFNALADSEE